MLQITIWERQEPGHRDTHYPFFSVEKNGESTIFITEDAAQPYGKTHSTLFLIT